MREPDPDGTIGGAMKETVLTSPEDLEDDEVAFRFKGGRPSPNAARASMAVDAIGWELLSEPALLEGTGDGSNDDLESGEMIRGSGRTSSAERLCS